MVDKLTGIDYINMPMIQLVNHPNFNVRAFKTIVAMSQMSSEQLEKINLLGGDSNG